MGPSGNSAECTLGGDACHGDRPRRLRPNFAPGLILDLMGTTLNAHSTM